MLIFSPPVEIMSDARDSIIRQYGHGSLCRSAATGILVRLLLARPSKLARPGDCLASSRSQDDREEGTRRGWSRRHVEIHGYNV